MALAVCTVLVPLTTGCLAHPRGQNAQRQREQVIKAFRPPSVDKRPAAQLERIRNIVRPSFYSTDAQGRKVRGLGALPRLQGGQSPLLFVGNHQLYGYLDQPLLVEQVWLETGVLLRSLAHRESFRSPASIDGGSSEECATEATGGWLLSVDLERFGGVPVSPRSLYTLLSAGQPALLYPGGMREALKSTKRGEAYQLVGWPTSDGSSDFARLAARFGATIITVAGVGAEDSWAMMLDADEVRNAPSFLGLVNEMDDEVSPLSVPLPPERYYYCFGKPRSASGVDPTDRKACASLLAACRADLEADVALLLDRRKNDPCRGFFERQFAEKVLGWTELPYLSLD